MRKKLAGQTRLNEINLLCNFYGSVLLGPSFKLVCDALRAAEKDYGTNKIWLISIKSCQFLVHSFLLLKGRKKPEGKPK